MVKVALLVGVGKYERGLLPLPSATKDVEALRQVLLHPEIGAFDEVTVLTNPERQHMEEEIEQLFGERHRDDLTLLFFSGHGITDDTGKLYLATPKTYRSPRNGLSRATAVSAGFIHDCMTRSYCRRQVVILDSCFSGAFPAGLTAMDDGSVDVRAQLGGRGRAILTSSTSTQYSFVQQGEDLSIYTRYLIEGLITGDADQDDDGFIETDELHEYVSQKVNAARPAMTPDIFVSRQGFKIRLAKAKANPEEKYRKKVENSINLGTVSPVWRRKLDELRDQLGLPLEHAVQIEEDVLRPYRSKLAEYEQVFTEVIRQEGNIKDSTRNHLQSLQQELGLHPDDTLFIETQVTAQVGAYQQKLQRYERELTEALRQEYPLDSTALKKLQQLQQQLGLTVADLSSIQTIATVEAEEYWRRLQQYEQALNRFTQSRYPLNETQQKSLKQQQQRLGLTDRDIDSIVSRLIPQIAAYQQNLQQYEREWMEATQGKYPPDQLKRDHLRQIAIDLQLDNQDSAEIVSRITAQIETYGAALRQYEQRFRDALQRSHPFTIKQQQGLQQQLSLSDEDIAPINSRILAEWEKQKKSLTLEAPPVNVAKPPISDISTSGVTHEQLHERALQKAIAHLSTFVDSHQHRLQKVAGVLVLAGSSIGGWGLWSQHLEQADQATLAQIAMLDSGHQYDQCISQVQILPKNFRFLKNAQEHLNACRLNKARDLAGKGKFQEAIALAAQIIVEVGSYKHPAQDAIETWSNNLIDQAKKQYQVGKKDEAIAALNVIPANSLAGRKAKDTINQWKKEWETNEANLAKVEKAIVNKDCETAEKAGGKVTTTYWIKKSQSILEQANKVCREIQPETAPKYPGATSAPLAEPAPAPLVEPAPASKPTDKSQSTPSLDLPPIRESN